MRSQLFVPGNRPDWMRKALDGPTDSVVIDLEDAVPHGEKAAALAATSEFITANSAAKPCWVRVSTLDGSALLAELGALVPAGVAGFVLPKVATPDEVRCVDRLVGWFEADSGRERGSTGLAPGIETAYALRFSYSVATSSKRVRSMAVSTPPGGDVARSIGYRDATDSVSTLVLRAFSLLSLRAAGVTEILAGVWIDVADLDGLRRYAEASRALGFDGMRVIHPSHVPVVNEIFTVDESELAHHRAVVAALEEAERDGRAAVRLDGEMIDIAMLATSQRVLEQHDALFKEQPA